ncbi:MAG: anthranilate synthase component I family protein [Schleiferiaceae bacterium]|nr:anthranilate synthase component I family protein [Schleiferiaceae bacterium]
MGNGTDASNQRTFTKEQVLAALEHEIAGIFLDSNGHKDTYSKYDWLAAGGVIQSCTTTITDLRKVKEKATWLFGGFSYDLKNDFEKLTSSNPDKIDFPALVFFEPAWVVYEIGGKQTVWVHPDGKMPKSVSRQSRKQHVVLHPVLTKAAYLEKINAVQQHIQLGDVYELTFCQTFEAQCNTFDPISGYQAINQKTVAPFSGYLKWQGRHLMCGSPERYLAKRGQQLISQPIKGTAPRGTTAESDDQLKTNLLACEKERAENVMIVDLVRNDLSRVAARGSVSVPELFGIYSFETVHQMISTVTARLHERSDALDAIAATFPMGSMTGAPKVRAMELIETYETRKRGLFSGAIGYFDPSGDFDFNVIIRSLLYNEHHHEVSLQVGSAITILSEPEAEYEECLLKAAGIMAALSQ